MDSLSKANEVDEVERGVDYLLCFLVVFDRCTAARPSVMV